MSLVGIVIRLAGNEGISEIDVDTIGVGKGVYDRLKEIDTWSDIVVGVNNGEKPENEEDFINVRAQSYWRLGESIKAGYKLVRNQAWEELLVIKWKIQSDKKIKIKSKDEMLKEGILSPDVADALAMGFAKIDNLRTQKVSSYTPKLREFKKVVY